MVPYSFKLLNFLPPIISSIGFLLVSIFLLYLSDRFCCLLEPQQFSVLVLYESLYRLTENKHWVFSTVVGQDILFYYKGEPFWSCHSKLSTFVPLFCYLLFFHQLKFNEVRSKNSRFRLPWRNNMTESMTLEDKSPFDQTEF